jgi:wyosine [tRNA(Phe)-imidazoG37] synthetase (radical SAM superfamily)
MKADLVSLKIDTVLDPTWKKINQPCADLSLMEILNGITEFSESFRGDLITETMIVAGVNDSDRDIETIGCMVSSVRPDVSYLSIPLRPPAEKGVKIPDGETLGRICGQLSQMKVRIDLLNEYEGNDFSIHGDIEKELLRIASVHPIRQDSVREILESRGESWSVIDELVHLGELIEVGYGGKVFYMRNIIGED